jgi:GNAT superfamily N-acetyltransferase
MADDLSNLVRLTRAQLKPAAEMMSRAFYEYPLSLYLFPGEAERDNKAPYIFQSLICHGFLYGEVYATSLDLEGVAVWFHTEEMRRTLWSSIRCRSWLVPSRVGKEVMSRQRHFGYYVSAIHQRCAPFPHWNLHMLGVDPAHQGKGYAGVLLRAMLARIDRECLPCYVDTQREENVLIYQRHGFKLIEESKIPGTEITMWAMLREKAG